MSTLVVVSTALAVIAVAVSLQGVVVLLRRHTVDARRPGPLIERRRRARRGTVPPRLDVLEIMTAEALGGTSLVVDQMYQHLEDLARHAPRRAAVTPPGGARDRSQWMHDQLRELESAYREK